MQLRRARDPCGTGRRSERTPDQRARSIQTNGNLVNGAIGETKAVREILLGKPRTIALRMFNPGQSEKRRALKAEQGNLRC